MHHIRNVKQTFIKNKFIECDYYFLKSLRRAGSLVVEPKYGFFDTSCHSVCNSGPKSTAGKKWRLYISPQGQGQLYLGRVAQSALGWYQKGPCVN